MKNAKKAGVEKLVRFEEKDLFQADIHDANVVVLLLLNSVNLKLRPKLLREVKPGTRIVSNTFDMGDWKLYKEASVDGFPAEAYPRAGQLVVYAPKLPGACYEAVVSDWLLSFGL
jgi:hypothetical protein